MSPRWKRGALALFLAAGLTLTIFGLSVSASQSVDLNRKCSLSLSTSAFEDLNNTQVVLDLYRVAEARSEGEEVVYVPAAGLENLGLETAARGEPDSQALAGKVAAAVLDQAMTPAVACAAANEPVQDLSAGLYLVLARGADVAEYVERDSAGTVIATTAATDDYQYRFAPELVSLPYAGTGAWSYDLRGSLKATQLRRNAGLEITKTLESYNPALGTATFVYDVEAVLDRDGDGTAEKVYSDVLTLSFSAVGTKTLTVELPVGARVTVTEVYTGESYELSAGERTQTVTVEADRSAQVRFTNRWNGGQIGGTSVTNHFTYETDHWDWTPLADSTAE